MMEKTTSKKEEVKKLASWISDEVRQMLERLKLDNEKAEQIQHHTLVEKPVGRTR